MLRLTGYVPLKSFLAYKVLTFVVKSTIIMANPDIFQADTVQQLTDRIGRLQADTQATWGKMSVSQMLAHCCVAYEQVYFPEKFKPVNGLKRWLLTYFIKPAVTGPKPYPKNGRTGADFIIDGKRDFEVERTRLLDFIHQVYSDGPGFFASRESHSFGKLTREEWNILFYKHLDHHLTQFGV